MEIRKAKHNDITGALHLVQDAQAYFKAHHINQWQDGYPNYDSLMNDIEKGKGYVLCDHNQVIGYCYGSFEHEPNYDSIENGQWLTHNQPYYVVHRVVVSNEYKGKGLAGIFIDHFIDVCHHEHIHSIRMDTHDDNKSMQRFLSKHGFKPCGRIYLDNGDPRIGYELVLEDEEK